jgi:hypothetical protein
VETASLLWRETAHSAGVSAQSYVHGVGDGAGWIMDRFQENFGSQGAYLLDFYHVSEYLAAAAQAIVGARKAKSWLHRQQDRLRQNQWPRVLKTLEKHQEAVDKEEAPVRAAHRYIFARRKNLDYQSARRRNLPIGSGEIESAHRHVIQKRMKLSGCWWKETNAEIMLRLRVARANNLWNAYWVKN